MSIKVEWVDSGREPQCAPSPKYPNGIDLIAALPGERACTIGLSYPAKRCGVFMVECSECGLRVSVTTAGRPDDPRSLRMACKEPCSPVDEKTPRSDAERVATKKPPRRRAEG